MIDPFNLCIVSRVSVIVNLGVLALRLVVGRFHGIIYLLSGHLPACIGEATMSLSLSHDQKLRILLIRPASPPLVPAGGVPKSDEGVASIPVGPCM
jgi:hypothetical protein